MEEKTNIFKSIFSRKMPEIELRMFYTYIGCEMIWCVICGSVFLALKLFLPALAYLLLFTYLVFFVLALHNHPGSKFLKESFLVLTFVAVPIFWYLSGGNASSANALFIIEIILYASTIRGIKQKVYIILAMATITVVYILMNAFPERFSGYPMTDFQHYIASIALGSTVSIWIAFLTIYQKNEYIRENEKVVRVQNDLKRSNRMQKNFLANMSHEIRSPLGIVLGFNNLIKGTDDVKLIHEYSDNIEQAGSTLTTVINDILDYSKIEAGKLDIIKENYSLKKMLGEISHDIKLRCEEKGLEYQLDLTDNLPDYLFGDSIRIKQCLLNLLTNAVKYTDRGTVALSAASSLVYENGTPVNELIFCVTDTGKGISDDLVPKLFTPFQRLDEGHNRGIEGTGLGLAITKSLLDEMEGSIHVSSIPGEGSVFTMIIRQPNGVAPKQSKENADKENQSISGLNVLAVDDTVLNLTLIDKMLSKHGVNVKSVSSGKDAIADAMSHQYDLILLDHMMPEMDGLETFKNIKERCYLNRSTPIIMLTANAMTGAAKEYIDMGFDDYISKPINGQELVSKIYLKTRGKSEEV